MLETFLIDQGIIRPKRISLLCIPDYLFFRTHSHRLYREFIGVPRYSIITRQVTDEINFEAPVDDDCTLKTLYIVDGASALTNAPFFFPYTKQLDLSVVGTNLDITELPKLRYTNLARKDFQKFEPLTIASSEVIHHPPREELGLENKAVTLPRSYNLFSQSIEIEWYNHTIAVGSVREMNNFFPGSFDMMRINLGDMVEYNQRFTNAHTTPDAKKARTQAILKGLGKVINSFNIPVIFISFYKIAKFFAKSDESISKQVQNICDLWGFSEAMLINNERRRVWEEEPMANLVNLSDARGYIALFNTPKKRKEIKTVSSYEYEEFSDEDDILDG